jgi:hypothetical protein
MGSVPPAMAGKARKAPANTSSKAAVRITKGQGIDFFPYLAFFISPNFTFTRNHPQNLILTALPKQFLWASKIKTFFNCNN